jgi:hypothetical protein
MSGATNRIILWCSPDDCGRPEYTLVTLAGITDPIEALHTAVLALEVDRAGIVVGGEKEPGHA